MYLLVWMLVFISSGCTNNQTTQPSQDEEKDMSHNSVRTDTSALSMFVNLSEFPEPTQTNWVQRAQHGQREGKIPAPTDYHVVALLEYNSPQTALSEPD